MPKERVFAVFGLGTFGMQVCEVLSKKGGKVLAVDNNEKLVSKVKDMVTQALLMDSTDEDALKNAGMEDVDVAVVAIGDDIDSSILTTALLRKLQVPYIISRAVSSIHSRVLKQIGANEIINLEIEEGVRLANKLISPDVLEIIPLSASQFLAQIYAPKKFIGKTIQKLDIRNKFNVNVISIKREVTDIDDMGNPEKKEVAIFPKAQEKIQKHDILVLVGNESDIEEIKE